MTDQPNRHDYAVNIWIIQADVLRGSDGPDGPDGAAWIALDAPSPVLEAVGRIADQFDAAVCLFDDTPIGWGLGENDYGQPTYEFAPFSVMHDRRTWRAWAVCENCSVPAIVDEVPEPTRQEA